MALLAIAAVKSELGALALHQAVEQRKALDAEPLAGGLAAALVIERRQAREFLELGGIVDRASPRCAGAGRLRLTVRRRGDQRLELLAAVAEREPVGNIAALRDLRPVRRQIEPADALREAERQLAGGVGVLVAGRIVVAEHDDIGAGEL